MMIIITIFLILILGFAKDTNNTGTYISNQLNLKLSVDVVMSKFITLYTVDEFPNSADLSSPFPCIVEQSNSSHKYVNVERVKSILLMGDSVNRYMVEEYCDRVEGKFTHNWGTGFHQNQKQRTSSSCEVLNLNLIIGFLHIFGSESVGPYHENRKSNNDKSDFTDTIIRIPKGIEQFQNLIGSEIDFIFYRTDLWDLAQFSNTSYRYYNEDSSNFLLTNRKALINRFIENNLWAIKLIRQLSPSSYIGTHTIPRIKHELNLDLFAHFENAVRFIAHQSGIFLFDWNLQFANMNPDEYLRDNTHPSYWYSSGFLEFVVKVLLSWAC